MPDIKQLSREAATAVIGEFQSCLLVPDGYTHEMFYSKRLADIIESVLTNSDLFSERSINALAAKVFAVCKSRGWSLHWTHRGVYLHLESSELIEALRGKRGDVLGEAGDVLFVLMSITENSGIPFSEVIEQLRKTAISLETKPHYAGEEFSALTPDRKE